MGFSQGCMQEYRFVDREAVKEGRYAIVDMIRVNWGRPCTEGRGEKVLALSKFARHNVE